MDPIAREYLRVSKDSSGRMRSPEEQHDENAKAAADNGWPLGAPYEEAEAVSASRYGRKTRADFARLVADLETGQFGAQILILWESSRGSRKLSEWARFLEQVREAGVLIYVTSHRRTYDLANPRDMRTLQEDGVDSEYQSAKQSLEIARALAANARAGLPHGRVTYGYRRVYDLLPSGRRVLVAQVEEPAEAVNVRELFARLRKGVSLRAIERDWQARGILTRTGKVFSARHLRDMGLRPAYAGLRTYRPGTRAGGSYRGPLDDAVKATWPALVGTETFFAVRELLLDPARLTSRPGRGVHLMSLIGTCGVCGSELTVRYRRGERIYICRASYCVGISANDLDEYAEGVMCDWLAQPKVIAKLRVARSQDAELVTLRADLAQARSELARLREAGRTRKLSVATMLDMEPALVAHVEQLAGRETELLTPPALSVIPPGKDVARRWQAAPMSARRQVARLLCSPPFLGTLRVTRTPTPGRRPADVADRVTWECDTTGDTNYD